MRGGGEGGENTYSLVKLGTSLSARRLGLLLVLLATAGQLALDLCGGLVDVGCWGRGSKDPGVSQG